MNSWETLWRRGSLPVFGSDFDHLSRQDDNGEPSLKFRVDIGPPVPFKGDFELDEDLPPEPSFKADFGENFLGIKNLTDLSDLLAAKDKEFQVLHDAVSKTPTSSPPWPPNGYASWYADYQKLIAAWQPARAAALAAIASTGAVSLANPLGIASPNTQTGEPHYGNILKILQPTPGTVTHGDLQDLSQRLNSVQAIPAYTVPQPTKGADQQITLRDFLAPADPIGNPKAAEDWKRDAIFGGAILVGMLFLASVVAKKV